MNRTFLVVGFVFGILETLIVDSGLIFALAYPTGFAYFASVGTAANVLSFVVDPVVVFVAMFLLGRRVDFPQRYLGTFTQLFVGVLAGTMLTFISVTVYYVLATSAPLDIPSYVGTGIFYYGLGSLRLSLVGFAGLAMAHFSRHPSVGPGPVPP